MKIIRRSFGEKYALLELEDGDYYHLPLESKYIPHKDQDLHIFNGGSLFAIWIDCPHCQITHETHLYSLIDHHHLKEL